MKIFIWFYLRLNLLYNMFMNISYGEKRTLFRIIDEGLTDKPVPAQKVKGREFLCTLTAMFA